MAKGEGKLFREIIALKQEMLGMISNSPPGGALAENYDPDWNDAIEASGMLNLWFRGLYRPVASITNHQLADFEKRARLALQELQSI